MSETTTTTTKPANTPGYNCRLAVYFTNKNGKRRARYYSLRQMRSFPLPLADAELWAAQDLVDVIDKPIWLA